MALLHCAGCGWRLLLLAALLLPSAHAVVVDADAVVDDYLDGTTVKDLAAAYGRSPQRISQLLSSRGVRVPGWHRWPFGELGATTWILAEIPTEIPETIAARRRTCFRELVVPREQVKVFGPSK